MPVVSAPTAAAQDEELTFTCTSTDGYPRPNVYWINKTDNSLLAEALQNSTVSRNARGLYDVVSVLRIRRAPHVDVGCCIENVLLHQNLTVSSQKGGGEHLPPPGFWARGMGGPLGRQSLSQATRQRQQGKWLEGRGRKGQVHGGGVCGDGHGAGCRCTCSASSSSGAGLVTPFTGPGLRL